MRRLIDGTPLTPELEADALARMEKGLDLRKTRVIFRADEDRESPRLSLRVPPPLMAQIHGEARRRKVTVSTIVRERLARR